MNLFTGAFRNALAGGGNATVDVHILRGGGGGTSLFSASYRASSPGRST